ncbi:MAG: cupin domain-containing protein [Rhodothermaceae bacterium]|nr:cupin domain-containing protein [Rhodothermaceae bacterium]
MAHLIVEPGDGTDYDWSNDHVYVKTPASATAGQVTVVEDTLKPGFHLGRHFHKRMTEVFYVLEGEVHFTFDNETVVARPGVTVTVPPGVMHEASCPDGGKMLTVFSPGGFDQYMAELASLPETAFEDGARMQALAEKYDTWMAEGPDAT